MGAGHKRNHWDGIKKVTQISLLYQYLVRSSLCPQLFRLLFSHQPLLSGHSLPHLPKHSEHRHVFRSTSQYFTDHQVTAVTLCLKQTSHLSSSTGPHLEFLAVFKRHGACCNNLLHPTGSPEVGESVSQALAEQTFSLYCNSSLLML